MVQRRKRRSLGSLCRRYRRFDEPQREPIAAIAAFVIHAGREAAHEMNAKLSHLRLLERTRRDGGWRLGRIELPAVIVDSGDQIFTVAPELAGDFEPIVPSGSIHDAVGDRLFE